MTQKPKAAGVDHPSVEDWIEYINREVRKNTAERGHYGSLVVEFSNGYISRVKLERGVKDPRRLRASGSEG